MIFHAFLEYNLDYNQILVYNLVVLYNYLVAVKDISHGKI